jgi:hypothetical protein
MALIQVKEKGARPRLASGVARAAQGGPPMHKQTLWFNRELRARFLPGFPLLEFIRPFPTRPRSIGQATSRDSVHVRPGPTA